MPGYASAEWVFASRMTILGAEVRVAVLWWVLFTAVASWVLLRTRFGNWVFATGGDEVAARNVGVPSRVPLAVDVWPPRARPRNVGGWP